MPTKLKFFNVNWEDGMKISKEHFIQQENAFNDLIKDVSAGFLNSMNYGLIPIDSQTEDSIKTTLTIDNHQILKVKIFKCRAISQGGARIEILEEHLLPEFTVNLTREIEMANKGDGEIYYILLTVDLFNRQTFGELDVDSEPPRYPFSIPSFKVNAIPEKQITANGLQPFSVFIGKINIKSDKPIIYDEYIPPCMTLKSHLELIRFKASIDNFFGKLEINLLSIIRKIKEKNQDTSLALTVSTLSEDFLRFISENYLRLQWHIPDSPPIYLFEYIATAARVIKNSIDANTASNKEEMLNYFTNWSELKQGDFEKLLIYCINFEYHHYDILYSVEQFNEFVQIIAVLFDKLESLAYVGKKKETNIFVKEERTKRSFLAE